jgi:diaminopimelate decarboxylase
LTGFSFDNGTLTCDGIPVAAIARAVGTPVYVYSAALVRQRFGELDGAFEGYPHRLHYALKANSTLALARIIRELGGGVDANSGGEIEVALRAGFAPADIVFTGVGKSADEIRLAVSLDVSVINAESSGELDRIEAMARAHGKRARVALRVNPDIDAESHPHISTGLRTHKFGVPISEAPALCRATAARAWLQLVGLHSHIGSQMVTLEPIRRATAAVVALADELASAGVGLECLDLGGGLGISYNGGPVPAARDYVNAIVAPVRPSGLSILLEPGRWIVGPAGALIAGVVDIKAQDHGKYFVVLDAGMSELMRPALYGAYHRIHVLENRGPEAVCDIVGPLCETSDVLGIDRRLSLPAVGDLVAVLDAGAYGAAMASNYNRHPLPAEVLVDQGVWRLIRRRQTLDDLLACEQ